MALRRHGSVARLLTVACVAITLFDVFQLATHLR